jgi:hypothetical protein
MRNLITLAVCAVCVAATAPAFAGPPTLVGQAAAHDVSGPLSEAQAVQQLAPGFRIEVQHQPRPDLGRPNVDQGEDPARQSAAQPFPVAAVTSAPLVNVPGLSDDDNAATIGGRVVPPDTQGDIGPDHYVQWINLILGVWDVTRDAGGTPTGATLQPGYPIAGNAIWAGFTGSAAADACRTTNNGDPIVLYDHLVDRWFISQFAINQGVQCIAISTTGDPSGSYQRWAFVVSPGENNDYPKFGLMPEAYYLSLRDFPTNDGTFASAVAFDRAAMLAGNPSPTFVKFSMPCLAANCPDGIQPPHLEGPAPPPGTPSVFVRAWDDDFEGPLTGADGYRIWRFVPDFATPAASTFTELPFVVSSNPWDSTVCGFFQRGCIPQPTGGGAERLDPADELQMYRAQWRHHGSHDSLVVNTTVDADGNDTAGVRWAELRNSGSGWTIHQEGTYAPADGDNRWMGSAAMNGSGDIALGYSVSSSATFPSVRYTTRTATDPAGTLPGGEVTMIAGAGAQTASSNRWGDYSSMSVDPVDDCTFWYTQEYYENTGSFDFKTRIGAIPGPSCGDGGGCEPTGSVEGSCTNGVDEDCDGLVDCADPDCDGDPACEPACVPIGPSEIFCSDELDDDCDGLIDCADPDCDGAAACMSCLPQGASCVNDSECCSEKCKGKPGAKTCK